MKKIYAGIDFGTTNTAAAIAISGDEVKIVPIEDNYPTIPTAIFFEDKTGQVFFGRRAMEKYTNGASGRFMRSIKRVLGTSLMRTGTVINGRPISFHTVITMFLKNVKEKIDSVAGQNIECVVMGRPVHFRDNDPDGDTMAEAELKNAAIAAGFKEVLFQYEPTAGAFAHEASLKETTLAAVIDIGGGTSDFTIIRLGGNSTNKTDRQDDIMANTGIRIGGNDFDKQLSLRAFMPEFGMGTKYNSGTVKSPKMRTVPSTHFFDLSEWSQVNALYTYKTMNDVKKYLTFSAEPEKYGRLAYILDRQLGHQVLATVEDTKIALTNQTSVEVSMNYMADNVKIQIARETFENAISDNTNKILNISQQCVNQSGIKPNDVQLIVLTGGSTEIPYIRDTLCNLFPNGKISAENKLSSVAMGLAYDALRRFAK